MKKNNNSMLLNSSLLSSGDVSPMQSQSFVTKTHEPNNFILP